KPPASAAASTAATSPKGSAASPSAKQATVKVQLLWVKNVQFGGNFAAEKMGYARGLGIQQDLIPGGPQVNTVQAVAGGVAPVGLIGASEALIQARANGIPVKAFATSFQKAPFGLISLAKSPIKTPHDAIGKRIGLQAGARPTWSLILAANGISLNQMTIIPVGIDPSPLVNGQVDGYWGSGVGQALSLQQKGVQVHTMLAADVGVPSNGNVIFALDKTIQEQEALLVRWLQATIKGWQYFSAHTGDIAAYTVEQSPSLKLDPKQQSAMAKGLLGYLTSPLTEQKGLLWMDLKGWTDLGDLLVKTKQIKAPVKVEDVMTTSLLEKAYGGKRSLAL
ncbi:MAG: ABC transporter substrate-binding protein, partial [Chloroflexota bacterium]